MIPSDFTEQIYEENANIGMHSYYSSGSQYEELPDHIIKQIEQAVLSKNESELTGLLSEVERYSDRTHYNRIKAHLGLLQGRVDETISIIKENKFPAEIQKEMQSLWSQAQKLIENRNLSTHLKPKRVSDVILSAHYKTEAYPKLETRVMLAAKTGLTEKKVNTWFKNKRQREKKM